VTGPMQTVMEAALERGIPDGQKDYAIRQLAEACDNAAARFDYEAEQAR
jgi:hypothetical protein